MKSCEQTKGMSVYEHGKLVSKYYKDLLVYLRTGASNLEWRIPTWLDSNKEKILANLLEDSVMQRYQVYHDCGKPYCRIQDSDGKVHFPDHANMSANVWSSIFPEDTIVTELIRNDMKIHTMRADEIDAFKQTPLAISLLITGLCEIHANASMFGGIESISFKIKWKHLEKRGRRLF